MRRLTEDPSTASRNPVSGMDVLNTIASSDCIQKAKKGDARERRRASIEPTFNMEGVAWLMTEPTWRRLAGSSDDDQPAHCSDDNPYEVLKSDLADLPVGALVATTIIIMSLGSLAAGAGIGGGGLFVPMYSFILLHSGKAAVPLR